MKTVFFLYSTLIWNIIYADTLDDSKNAKILYSENKRGENGMYSFYFKTSDGIARRESGKILTTPGKEGILRVSGFYSYFDDKGKKIDVHYIADDRGYRLLPPDVSFRGALPPGAVVGGAPPGEVKTRIDPSVIGSLVGSGVG